MMRRIRLACWLALESGALQSGVFMMPGRIIVTPMPQLLSSRRIESVTPTTANLDAL